MRGPTSTRITLRFSGCRFRKSQLIMKRPSSEIAPGHFDARRSTPNDDAGEQCLLLSHGSDEEDRPELSCRSRKMRQARRQKPLGIVVLRIVIDVRRLALIDDPAAIHDHDIGCEIAHQRQVVGDEDVG